MNTQEKDQKMQTGPGQNENQNNVSKEADMAFTPRRFSVRGLRKHVGIKTSRTPRVAF